MIGIAFSAADRRLFERACIAHGQIPVERLQERLINGLWLAADSARQMATERLYTSLGRSCLLRAGELELQELLSSVPVRSRRLLAERLPGFESSLKSRRGRRVPAAVLESLQMALWPAAGAREGEWLLRAGAHRLARAAADLDASQADLLAVRMPETSRGCFKAAWMRLSKIAGVAKRASDIRRQWNEEN